MPPGPTPVEPGVLFLFFAASLKEIARSDRPRHNRFAARSLQVK